MDRSWQELQFVNNQKKLDFQEPEIASLVAFIFRCVEVDACVEVVLVDDEEISSIHLEYLNKSGPTDVISFPMNESLSESLSENPPFLGTVVVSTDTAIQQAPSFLKDARIETLQYIVHGILHLLEYDDIDPDDRKIMESKQEEILQAWLKSQS